MGKTNKKSVREKKTAQLVQLPGCHGCAKMECKYNGQVATALAASHFDENAKYQCNSTFGNVEQIESEDDNEQIRKED